MQQPGVLIFGVVLVIIVFAAAIVVKLFRDRFSGHSTPNLPLSEKARAVFTPNDPSLRSPAGSMAARREDIEDLLLEKEDQS
jgi:hypothetical protein